MSKEKNSSTQILCEDSGTELLARTIQNRGASPMRCDWCGWYAQENLEGEI